MLQNTTTPRPFSLTASSKNGSVTVTIPSTFVGPVALSSQNGSISLSPAVQARTVVFSDVDGKRSCFIGDVRNYSTYLAYRSLSVQKLTNST